MSFSDCEVFDAAWERYWEFTEVNNKIRINDVSTILYHDFDRGTDFVERRPLPIRGQVKHLNDHEIQFTVRGEGFPMTFKLSLIGEETIRGTYSMEIRTSACMSFGCPTETGTVVGIVRARCKPTSKPETIECPY